MAGIVADGIKPAMLQAMIDLVLSGGEAGLYTAGPAIILPGATLADFTEAGFTGYRRSLLPTWSAPILTADHHATSSPGPLVFSNHGAAIVTVRGWFLVVGSTLVAAENWSPPKTIGPGESLVFRPSFSDASEF